MPMVAILVLALAVHLLPLSSSPYPFNNDGITESVAARGVLDSGHLTLPAFRGTNNTHSESTPVFSLFLAFVGGALGQDPMFVSQIAESGIALLLVMCAYLLILEITRDVRAALIGAFVICVFGSFLFLTASVWREGLGVSLYMLLVYAFTRRVESRMRILEVLVLLTLPFVHHLVALIAYATVGFLTVWSTVHAARNGALSKRNYYDLGILAGASAGAFIYYNVVAFGRLSYLDPLTGMLPLLLLVIALSVLAVIVLSMKRHWKGTFAPMVAGLLLILVLWDYGNPIFPYDPTSPAFIIILYVASAICLAFGWYGIEMMIESQSAYRAVPLCMLLPTMAVILFALVSPAVEDKQQIIYRSYDFADPALAVGAGIASAYLLRSKRARKLTVILVASAAVTLPYGIFTQDLLGLQHETQSFEVDGLQWAKDSFGGSELQVQTDVRLAYVGTNLIGLGEDNRLPQYLHANDSLSPFVYYVYERSWSERGVNDFPHGSVRINASYMELLLRVENVLYVGGPADSGLIIFMASGVGQNTNNWYPGVIVS